MRGAIGTGRDADVEIIHGSKASGSLKALVGTAYGGKAVWAVVSIVTKDLRVIATTLINSEDTLLKTFPASHIIIQEAGKADNGELFVAMAGSYKSMTLSGDPEILVSWVL